MKIFVFSWNTESIRLSETMSETESLQHRDGVIPEFLYTCERADFFPELVQQINSHSPDIVVIAFQEDSKPGSYFHSHLLPAEMPKINYRLLKRTKLMGVGKTTYNAMFNFDLRLRGLRLSIYLHDSIYDSVAEFETTLSNDLGSTQKEYVCTSAISRNKGGTVSYLRVPTVGTFAFLNAHLPFNSKSLLESVLKQDPMIRKTEVQSQNVAFNEIYRRLVLDAPYLPDYVIYIGDFNYRITGSSMTAFQIAEQVEQFPSRTLFDSLYRNHDELYLEMHAGGIYPLLEGVNNSGPMFLPTGKLMKNRLEGYDSPNDDNPFTTSVFKTGLASQRCPSWCDRILYGTLTPKTPMSCYLYDRFDHGITMKKSDHAGVIACFDIPTLEASSFPSMNSLSASSMPTINSESTISSQLLNPMGSNPIGTRIPSNPFHSNRPSQDFIIPRNLQSPHLEIPRPIRPSVMVDLNNLERIGILEEFGDEFLISTRLEERPHSTP